MLDPKVVMLDSKVAVDSTVAAFQRFMGSLSEGLQWAELTSYQREVTFFRAEDAVAWGVFSAVFVVLIIFDNFVLHRNNKALSIFAASAYTLFWVFCACLFCLYIYYVKGQSSAFNWMTGYLLEWMLSFDNLFVFHLIFQNYATPDNLKHKPLFWGICGAVFFRLLFLFIGEWMMHTMFFAHILFGAFLVYTGGKAALFDDDDDEDPSKHPLVQWLQRCFPFVGAYDSKGSFFVQVPVDEQGQPLLDVHSQGTVETEEGRSYGLTDFEAARRVQLVPHRLQWRATMLFLVVVCLEVSDILFAVDSVSAIVAQVPDLFLAYTSAVFAMLGLRATFFIVDELVRLFSFLKYGVAAVLVFIGVKLILSKMVHIPAGIVFCVLFGTLSLSMLASVVQHRFFPQEEKAEKGSPIIVERTPAVEDAKKV